LYQALHEIGKSASSDPLYALVMVPESDSSDSQGVSLIDLADSKARLAFSESPNIVVVPKALRVELDPMPAWGAPDSAFDPLCRQLLKRLHPQEVGFGVMFVLVREFTPDTEDGYWIQVQQRTFIASTLKDAEDDADKLEADKTRIAEAFTRD